MEVQHPDEFLSLLIDLAPGITCLSIKDFVPGSAQVMQAIGAKANDIA